MELCQYPYQGKTRYFTIEAIQIPIVYNKYGDHNPDGLLYVLEEDAKKNKKRLIADFIRTLHSHLKRYSH